MKTYHITKAVFQGCHVSFKAVMAQQWAHKGARGDAYIPGRVRIRGIKNGVSR